MGDKGYCLTEKGLKTIKGFDEISLIIHEAKAEFIEEYKQLIDTDNQLLINRDKGILRFGREILYFIVQNKEARLNEIIDELKMPAEKAGLRLVFLNKAGFINQYDDRFTITEKGEKAAIIYTKFDQAYIRAGNRLDKLLDEISV